MSDQTKEQVESLRVYRATGFMVSSKASERSSMENKMVETWRGMANWKAGNCRVCNCEIPYNKPPDIMVASKGIDQTNISVIDTTPAVCDECVPLTNQHYGEEEKPKSNGVTPKWDEDCPQKFKDIIRNPNKNDSRIDWESYNKVAGWKYSEKGMYISGLSGLGKTTAVWHLFREVEKASGHAPQFIKAVQLARVLSRAARDINDDPVKLLSKWGVLIIDDIGKEKITNSFAAQLFDLIDARYENNRPTIITSKFAGGAFMRRFDEVGDASTGNDIVRRLSETCEGVDFSEK